MAIKRFYIVPVVGDGLSRATAYMPAYWDTVYAGMPYGVLNGGLRANRCILMLDADAATHAALLAKTDVLGAANIDAVLTAGQATVARNRANAIGIPSDWIVAGVSVRQIFRVIAGMFLFWQRYTALNSEDAPSLVGARDGKFSTAKLRAAAQSLGFNAAAIADAGSLKSISKLMADAWGSTPIYIGGEVL